MLSEKQVYYTFMCQKNNHYLLDVVDVHGKMNNFRANSFEDIEKSLKLVWGHLLQPTLKLPPLPALPMV